MNDIFIEERLFQLKNMRIKKLEAEVNRLREALAVYADNDNWEFEFDDEVIKGKRYFIKGFSTDHGWDIAENALRGEK